MNKDGAIKVMDPPPTKALLEKFPTEEMFAEMKETGKQAVAEVRKVSLRTTKTITHWWRALPNDGVRAGVAAGVGLVIGLIPVLFVIYRRRAAPVAKKETATRP